MTGVKIPKPVCLELKPAMCEACHGEESTKWPFGELKVPPWGHYYFKIHNNLTAFMGVGQSYILHKMYQCSPKNLVNAIAVIAKILIN